jgi:hypothetical protein
MLSKKKNRQRLNADDIPEVPVSYEQEHKHRNVFKPLLLFFLAIIIIAVTIVMVPKTHVFHAIISILPRSVANVKPTPVPVPHLESTPYRITINLQPKDDMNKVITQQVQSDKHLQGQKAGLVIIYTGAPTDGDSDIGNARKIDEQVKKLLQSLKTNGFANALYYDKPSDAKAKPSTDLYALFQQPSFIVIDIYLFAQ